MIPSKQQTKALLWTHCTALVLCAIYVSIFYPAGVGPVFLLVLTGAIGMFMPDSWRRFFVQEFVFLVIGGLSLLIATTLDHDSGLSPIRPDSAFAAWVRISLAHWTLIPVRRGWMRLLGGLLCMELLLLMRGEVSAVQVGVLVPGILGALATDTWTRSMYLPRSEVSITGMVHRPWPMLSVIMVILLGLAGSGIGTLTMGLRQDTLGFNTLTGGSGAQGRTMAPEVRPGDDLFTDQNTTICARLVPDDPRPPGSLYLRSRTVPILRLEGPHLVWTGEEQALRALPDSPRFHGSPPYTWATLQRQPGDGDIVYRPDGSAALLLTEIFSDADGNLFRDEIGDFTRAYRVDLGAPSFPIETWLTRDAGAYRTLPDSLRDLLESNIPELERWRFMSGPDAATAIELWLQDRARYAMRGLPEVANRPLEGIRTFLFGDANERIGHCQYFSSAATVLLRAAGHAARPVIGFVSEERQGRILVVRALHAHAWVEVLDGSTWHRSDPTPADHMSIRQQGVDIPDDGAEAEDILGSEGEQTNNLDEGLDQNGSPWRIVTPMLIGIGLLGILCMVVVMARKAAGPSDPKERALSRHRDQLLRLALEAGLEVRPATTVTGIIDGLMTKTGLDLSAQRHAYLSARFGEAEIPPPWPMDEIRKKLRETNTQSARTHSAQT